MSNEQAAIRSTTFAFPRDQGSGGLTVREYYAAAALHGILAGNQALIHAEAVETQTPIREIIAREAFLLADAMLLAAEKYSTANEFFVAQSS